MVSVSIGSVTHTSPPGPCQYQLADHAGGDQVALCDGLQIDLQLMRSVSAKSP
jgi:hypothetical protein